MATRDNPSSPRGIRVAFESNMATDDSADDGALDSGSSWFERIFCGCGTACGTVDNCFGAVEGPKDFGGAPVAFEDEPGYTGASDDFASFDHEKTSPRVSDDASAAASACPPDEEVKAPAPEAYEAAPRADDASAAASACPIDEHVKHPAPEEYEPPTPSTPGVGVLHAAQRWRTRDAPGDAKRLVPVRLPTAR